MKAILSRMMWLVAASVIGQGSALAAGHETPSGATPSSKQETKRVAEELVTTARRTEESILEVPLSITTFNAAEIQAAQIVNLSDVAAMTPNFSFQNYFGQEFSVPTVRGVAQIDIFGDPNAPIFIDGIYVSSKAGINFSFLDVERIEILRGPQPAYFGYNAFSGAVNFVTAKPSDEMEINGELTLGTDDKRRISASISGPMVGDVLSGRITALYDDFGGTYDNASGFDQDIGGAEYKTLSASLFLTPSDVFSAQLNLYLSDDHIDPPSMSSVAANCEPTLDQEDPLFPNDVPNQDRLLNFCGEIPSVSSDSLSTIAGETGQERDVFRTSLNMDWDVGFGTFSSLTGYSITKDEIATSSNRGSAGETFAYQSDVPGFIPGSFVLGTFTAPFIQSTVGPEKLEDFSQELRYTSPRDRATRFTLGAYYRTTTDEAPIAEESLWAPLSSLPDDIATFDFGFPGSPVFYEFCPCAVFGPPGSPGVSAGFGGFIFTDYFAATPPGFDYMTTTEKDLWAGFFAVEQDIGDRVTVALEGRYTDYQEEFKSTQSGFAGEPAFKDDFFNWRTSVDYRPTDTMTIYGSIATGVKQGGLDIITPETVSPDPDCPGPACVDDVPVRFEYGQEEITTYELGYKAAYLDGDLIVDGAVFYSDWQKIVLPQIVSAVGGKAVIPEGVQGNIGDGTITGIELSARARFNDMFSGGMGLSYTKSEFDKGNVASFVEFPSFAPDGNMSGQSFSRTPELQGNVNLTARKAISADWESYIRGDVNYQSSWTVGLPNQAKIPGRFRANLRWGFEYDEKYSVELWANNIFDDDSVEAAFRDVYLSNAIAGATQVGNSSFSQLFPWRLTVSHPQGRTLGVTMRGRF